MSEIKDTIVEGYVKGFLPAANNGDIKDGAFITIFHGIDGFLHKSNASGLNNDNNVNNMTDHLNIGDCIKVKVIDVKMECNKPKITLKIDSSNTP